MTSRARMVLVAGLAVLAGGIACGGGDGDSGPPDSGRKTVLVDNNVFQDDTVTISAGDTVLWSWKAGSIEHNIISNGAVTFENDGTPVLPGSGTLGTDFFSAPHSHEVIFPTAGTYQYYCSTHGTAGTPNTGMKGTVIVN